MPSVDRDPRYTTRDQAASPRGRRRAGLVARAAIGVAAGLTLMLVFARSGAIQPVVAANDVGAQVPNSVALAQELTAALNAHDVEALVDLFSDEGPGATVHADRYAWTSFEIRLWAQHQVRANVRVGAYNYEATEHGAAWTAIVYREDWQELGVDALPVFNTIWVEDGKIADFTSRLASPGDAERLQHLWRPGAPPDYPTS